jgi:putative oxidoreductase
MLDQLIRDAQITDILLLIVRLTLGLVIFPHGAQKLLGWWGGYGYNGTMNWFTQTMKIPYLFGFAAIVAEFFGSIALIIGLLTRPAALGIGVTMIVAAWMVHRPNGFFMNWFGNQQGEGYEYFILAIGLTLVLIVAGGGAYSVDALLFGM